MADPVSSIKNLGPASDAAFARAGIYTAEEIRELGADAAYARLLAAGSRPHFIGYYALVMGLQGRPWNDARGTEKVELRHRFDRLKNGVVRQQPKDGLPLALSDALDQIGVRGPQK